MYVTKALICRTAQEQDAALAVLQGGEFRLYTLYQWDVVCRSVRAASWGLCWRVTVQLSPAVLHIRLLSSRRWSSSSEPLSSASSGTPGAVPAAPWRRGNGMKGGSKNGTESPRTPMWKELKQRSRLESTGPEERPGQGTPEERQSGLETVHDFRTRVSQNGFLTDERYHWLLCWNTELPSDGINISDWDQNHLEFPTTWTCRANVVGSVCFSECMSSKS